MNIKKVVITKGIYLNRELRLLVSFDENDKPVDIINLDITKVGEYYEASVEKVLTDIDACILKLDSGDKGFIENKKLNPDEFIYRHSDKKLVCQADKLYVKIIQDRNYSKPYSCAFASIEEYEKSKGFGFLDYYIKKFCNEDIDIISDFADLEVSGMEIRFYQDDSVSLWQIYDLTKILDNVISMRVNLSKGGNIIIEKTEALTVIDINTGKNYGKTSFQETNLIAAKEIARQIRLRQLSGMFVIDFLKVSKEEQQEIIDVFKDASKDDMSQISIHGFTNLGLLEITRSRIFSPIVLAF